jgi:carotenoid cleavage dioxygenase
MNRRSFLQTLAGGGAALAPLTLASQLRAAEPGLAERFAAARRRNPMLAGFDNAPASLDVPVVRVEGRVPAGLSGVFYRNGPGQHERAGERYHHWFDGDGFIQRWQIGADGITFRGRILNTPKRQAEEAAGRFLFPAGGGGIPARSGMAGPDSINVANTSLLPVNGQLWALWEGGSASRVNPETLDYEGLVRLRDDLAGAPFSAHPRVGEDGRIWNTGCMGPRLVLYRLSATGQLEAARLHAIPPVGFVHDFLLTSRSVVAVLSSTRLSGAGDGMFARIRGRPDLPMQVKVFDRETLALTREGELPPGYVFHFGNAWEEADGTIRFDMVHTMDTDQVQQLRRPMAGEMPSTDSRMLKITLPVSGAPRLALVRNDVEFPRVSPLVQSRRNRFVYAAAQAVPGRSAWFDAVGRFDLETGDQRFARFGDGWMVEEPVFVPRAGGTAEDDGWLICTALNWRSQRTALTILDARTPQNGPLARAWLDLPLPLGFHGQFVGA